jgi:hypothetical protein
MLTLSLPISPAMLPIQGNVATTFTAPNAGRIIVLNANVRKRILFAMKTS